MMRKRARGCAFFLSKRVFYSQKWKFQFLSWKTFDCSIIPLPMEAAWNDLADLAKYRYGISVVIRTFRWGNGGIGYTIPSILIWYRRWFCSAAWLLVWHSRVSIGNRENIQNNSGHLDRRNLEIVGYSADCMQQLGFRYGICGFRPGGGEYPISFGWIWSRKFWNRWWFGGLYAAVWLWYGISALRSGMRRISKIIHVILIAEILK